MAHKRKPFGRVMRDITGRTQVNSKTQRLLSCGHVQEEPSGGAVKKALTAFCAVCTVQALAEKKALLLETDSGSLYVARIADEHHARAVLAKVKKARGG